MLNSISLFHSSAEIPQYRLPYSVVDFEVELAKDLGVKVRETYYIRAHDKETYIRVPCNLIIIKLLRYLSYTLRKSMWHGSKKSNLDWGTLAYFVLISILWFLFKISITVANEKEIKYLLNIFANSKHSELIVCYSFKSGGEREITQYIWYHCSEVEERGIWGCIFGHR